MYKIVKNEKEIIGIIESPDVYQVTDAIKKHLESQKGIRNSKTLLVFGDYIKHVETKDKYEIYELLN